MTATLHSIVRVRVHPCVSNRDNSDNYCWDRGGGHGALQPSGIALPGESELALVVYVYRIKGSH